MMPVSDVFHNPARIFLWRWLAAFVLLVRLTVPFYRPLLPDPGRYIAPLAEAWSRWSGDRIFQLKGPYTALPASDATGMYLHLFHLAVLSILLTTLWWLWDRRGSRDRALFPLFVLLVRYSLAVELLAYGCNKVFKWQFYLPEPNTLFTPIGHMHRELLFWSTVGASWSYSVITGAVEVLAGLLLFFRRTALTGALLSFGVMVHVVIINFSYDIEVKVYALFLLLLSLILLVVFRRRLYPLLGKAYIPGPKWGYRLQGRPYFALKALVLLYLLADAAWIYIRSGNFNDDTARRPLLHGAYEVTAYTRNGGEVPPLLTDSFRWRRLFVHRSGYLIIQSMQETMTGYPLAYDTVRRQLHADQPDGTTMVLDYRQTAGSGLYLSGYWQGDSVAAALRKIDLQELPLLQPGFHWTMDR